MDSAPFGGEKTSGPELDDDDGDHEHEHVGEDRAEDPRQPGTQDADHGGAQGGPLERADAAEEDSEEALDQKAYAEIGKHGENRHHQPPGEAGEAGADGEGERVDAVGRDAGGARERGVLEGGPDREADASARQKDPESDQHDRRNEDNHAAPAGELERAQAKRADEGIGHRMVEATDEPPHALADDE